MALNQTQKIISRHLAYGEMIPGQEIGLEIDHNWNLALQSIEPMAACPLN